jgi:hypothetical protein
MTAAIAVDPKPGGGAGEEAVMVTGPKLGGAGRIGVRLDLVVRDGEGNITSTFSKDSDMTLLQSAQFFIVSQMGVTGLSFKDTSATAHSQTAQVLAGTPTIEFGTGSTAATWSDYVIQTAAGGTNPVTATVSAITANSTNGTFTVTATWTNTTGSTVTISELALYVTTTAGMSSNSTFALTHDVFTGQAVSATGTAAATLTFTFS